MSKTNEALARRWMASKHWGGWRAGMRCQITGRVCLGSTPSGNAVWHFDPGVRDGVGGGLPDLDHPGTRAFLLEDVRRAWGEDGNFASYSEFGAIYWSLDPAAGDDWERADTEASALIAALEAAP